MACSILGFHMTSRDGQGSVSRVKDGFYNCFILAFITVGEVIYIRCVDVILFCFT